MAIDEVIRHRIHGQLEQLLGTEEAAAIMSALTEMDDLAHTREVLMAHTTATVADLGSALRAEMNQQFRFMLQWMTGAILTAGSLGVAAGALL